MRPFHPAYIIEAYLAVDPGQREAALTSGLSESQTFVRIILPQAVVHALPNFANMLVSLMKEGALAYSIGLIDVMGKGQLIIGLNQGSMTLYRFLLLSLWLCRRLKKGKCHPG